MIGKKERNIREEKEVDEKSEKKEIKGRNGGKSYEKIRK